MCRLEHEYTQLQPNRDRREPAPDDARRGAGENEPVVPRVQGEPSGTSELPQADKQGSIEHVEQDRYKSSGIIEKVDDKTLDITELPIRTWTQNFKEGLEEMTSGGNDKVPQTIKVCFHRVSVASKD